jgi:hypothetical protein
MDSVPEARRADFTELGGVPTDLSATDAVVLAAAQRGLDVLPVVVRTPDWAAQHPGRQGSPPRDPQTYASFLRVLVARYGPDGTFWAAHPELAPRPLRRWQVWNEPDILKYFSPATSRTSWQKPYVRLLRAAHTALKQADPGCQVVLGGLTNMSWVDLRRLYQAGARKLFDVAAVHPFSNTPSKVVMIVGFVRKEMRKAHDARKHLLLTEVSFSSGKGHSTLNYGWESSESGQAERIRQLLPMLAKVRVRYRLDGMYWFTWLSPRIGGKDSFDYSGLLRLGPDDTVVDKPALYAWRDTTRALTTPARRRAAGG